MRCLGTAGLVFALLGPLAAAQPDDGALVLRDDTHLVLDEEGKVHETVRREVQVFGPAGQEEYGVLALGYDSFRRVKKMKGEVLGADGERLRKLRRGDVEDNPATSSFSLYDDYRVRVGRLYHDAYPYTVVWEYEVEHEGLLNWPTWRPQRGKHPVLLASLTVEVPEDVALRYLPERLGIEPEVSTEGRRRTFRWSGAFPGFTYEPLGPPWYDQVPVLHLATDAFTMDGHAGRLDSWAGLGHWYDTLADGRDDLPPEAAADVARLVSGVDDLRERARLVYGYLQQTTRYVSVQLGIGGWQPFPASYVHERRYGDCKALTNYLAALLEAAGVTAYPALIGHDRPDLAPDFPRNAFNHVVLYVPLPDGDLWLEATSQTAPFGTLGAGSEDRWTLVTEPGSGRLVRTPARSAPENAQTRQATVQLSAGGQATVRSAMRVSGHQLSRLRNVIASRSPQEQEEWWVRRLGLPTEGLHVAFDEGEGTVESSFAVPRYATRAGSRLLFHPNLAERWTAVPPPFEDRTQPIDLGYAFADTDSVRFALPAGYEVEALPEPVQVETPFARYAMTVEADGEGRLVYVRHVEVQTPRLPPEDYDAYRSFVAAVTHADDAQVILRKL
ncbi:MAG: DUF3857 domain-containing protein [Bacteroidota bacterium]